MEQRLQRRLYRAELRAALGYGDSWFREQQRRGIIPKGHTDPGGKREWFSEAEARQIVERMNKQAQSTAA